MMKTSEREIDISVCINQERKTLNNIIQVECEGSRDDRFTSTPTRTRVGATPSSPLHSAQIT